MRPRFFTFTILVTFGLSMLGILQSGGDQEIAYSQLDEAKVE